MRSRDHTYATCCHSFRNKQLRFPMFLTSLATTMVNTTLMQPDMLRMVGRSTPANVLGYKV